MKRIPFVFAFLLPPQVQDLNWTWEKQGKELQTIKARSLSSVSSIPFFHRFISWTADEQLRYPDASSGEWFQLNPRTSQVRSLGRAWTTDDLVDETTGFPKTLSLAGLNFRISENGRRVELLDPKYPGANVWLMDLPTRAAVLEWSSDGRDFLYAFARETREFFVISPRSLKAMKHIQWDTSVEIQDIVACSGREQLIVERPKVRALTRVVRLREWKPVGYTVFDLSQGKLQSDLSKTLTRNCREIFFAGPYGLQRVQY